MAFCANCGTEASGKFCPNCGAALGLAPPPPNPPTGAYVPPSAPAAVQPAGMSENVASALCYLLGLVTGIIFLVLPPYNQNKTVRFHAFQSIFTHLAIIVIWILFTVLSHGVGFLLFPLYGLAVLVLWLYMMYSAYNNRKVKLPLVGDFAEKQA